MGVERHMTWPSLAALLITGILCILAFIPSVRDRINAAPAAKRFDRVLRLVTDRYLNLAVFVIMIVGAAVRLWKFGIIPAGFNQDGAMGAVDALALAHYGTDRFGMWLPVHFTAWGFGQMSVLLSYLSVPFIALFGLNRFTARIAVLLVSLLALWVIYALSRLAFGQKAALIILAFSAVNPWHIMQSRWALDSNIFPHFLLFSVYFLYLGLKRKKIYLFISMIFFGLTMYSYGIAWYSIPLFLLITSIYLLKTKRLNFKETGLLAFTYLLVAWPIFGVMIINVFKLPTIVTPFGTIPYFPESTRVSDLLFFSPDFFRQLLSNIVYTVNTAILQKPDLPWNTIPQFGIIYLFSMPFFIIGLIRVIKTLKSNRDNEDKIFPAIILIWLAVTVISGIIINNVNVSRINIIVYPLIILAALGIDQIIRKIKLFGLAVLLIYMIAFLSFGASYFGQHSKVIAEAFYEGFGEALDYVQDMDYDRIYVTNWTLTENSYWASEPLTLFHHEIDALYFQGKADARSKDGRLLLPYKERYKYVSFADFDIDPTENAVYIVNKNELGFFNTRDFKAYRFADYYAVIPNAKSGPAENTGALSANSNLAANPGFESGADGKPDLWTTGAWKQDAGITVFSIDNTTKYSGAGSALIINNSANDSRYKQQISISGDTYYKLSCRIKTEGIGTDEKGANISVEGLTDTSPDVRGTRGWTEVTVYGKSDTSQKSFILTLGLGGYGSINTGKAWFDDVVVEEADIVPTGAKVINLYKEKTPASAEKKASTSAAAATANNYNVLMVIITVIYILAIVLAYYMLKRKKSPLSKEQTIFSLYIIFALALFIRLTFAPVIEGWPNDIATNKQWALNAAKSLTNFYNAGWSDYPPLFVYVLAIVGKLASIPWLQDHFTLLIKLPSIIADLVTSFLIYRLVKSRCKTEYAIFACGIYAFHPAVFLDSTIWGQVDSFLTMLVVAALTFHMKKKPAMSAVFFSAAILMKPQGIFFLPIVLFEVIKRRSLKYFMTVFCWGLLTAIVVVLPFALNQEPLWIFKLYMNTAGEYPSAAMNAFNIFGLVGANFVNGSNVPFLLSYNTWGLIFDIMVLGISAFIYIKSKHAAAPVITAIILNSGAFIFSVKMHERYMYPVIALLLIAFMYLKDRRILAVFIGFSVTVFMNIHILFYRMLRFGIKDSFFIGPEIYPVVFIFSLLNVLLFIYLIKTCYNLLKENAGEDLT